jgi:proliferating cell nuclear antigen PCNA
MDKNQSLMVDLFLDKNKLEEYYCPQMIQIGISIPNFFKLLKTMNSNNVLTLYMLKKNQSALEIVIDSNDSNQRVEFTLDLMDLDSDKDLGFPEDDYKLVLDMPSSEFKQICQNTKSIETKQIKITYSKGVYTFSAKGNIGSQKITRVAHKGVDEKDIDDNEIYEATYDLDKLSCFTKCASITKNVKIYLGNDLPLICEYELSCGVLNLLLAVMDEI